MEVIVNYHAGMKFSAQCGNHNLTIDLPEDSGGTDTAATPPQLFLSSLASCVGVYVVSYCKNTGLNTQGAQFKITAEKATHPNRLENIKIDIVLPNAEVGKRKDAVLAAAKKCLIHNTIKHHPVIDINLITE
ncbi:MAG: OsmC family protein [Candidatus Omnitrophota bacterium]